MNGPEAPVAEVSRLVRDALRSHTQRFADGIRGKEQIVLHTLVRTLDTVAAIGFLGRHRIQDLPSLSPAGIQTILYGATAGLRPLVPRVTEIPGPLPMVATDARDFWAASRYLSECGRLTHIARLLALQKYGLATVSKISPTEFHVLTLADHAERSDRAAVRAFHADGTAPDQDSGLRREERWKRMRRYVGVDRNFFIRYDNDADIVTAYLAEGQEYGRGFLEGEALPLDTLIGGRAFGDWKHACDRALGRVLCHVDFCGLLKSKKPAIQLWNALTIPVRKDDVRAIWRESGLPEIQVDATVRALALCSDDCDDLLRDFETPTSAYVPIGRDWFLLPLFGVLLNPYASLFRHLRKSYRADWDRGVDGREAVFREDLGRLLERPRFNVPMRGSKLRRSNGSVLTDIDAIAVDTQSGTLGLFQLKWHDPFGFSLAERESRKTNFAPATVWAHRVREWAGGASSRELCSRLGLHGMGSDVSPVIFVLGRYAARFTGEDLDESIATWLSWPHFVREIRGATGSDPLREVAERLSAKKEAGHHVEETESKVQVFELPGFSVQITSGSFC